MNDEGRLREWLGAHRAAVSGGSPTDHPDIDTLARHATNQLSPGKARYVSEHLLVCEDGRCVAFVRANAEDVDAAAALLYPGAEAEGMHARTFLCREALWEAFEDIAREQGAPIDDVLSEAMRAYARHRAGGAAAGEEARASDPLPGAHDYAAEDEPDMARTGMIRQPTQRMSSPTAEAPSLRRPMSMGNPNPPGHASPPNPRGGQVPTTRGVAPPHSAPPPRMPAPLPEPPGRVPLQRPFTAPIGHALPAPPPPRSSAGGAPRFPTAGMPLPPPPQRGMSPGPRAAAAPPPLPPPSDPYMAPAPAPAYGAPRGRVASALSLTYLNRSVDVTKERFILGRSKSQADLVLDDANVSRQHAAIERVGDTWFLADLGSTNGCYVDGQRVSRRQLSDGDVIEITTHQVRCTLR